MSEVTSIVSLKTMQQCIDNLVEAFEKVDLTAAIFHLYFLHATYEKLRAFCQAKEIATKKAVKDFTAADAIKLLNKHYTGFTLSDWSDAAIRSAALLQDVIQTRAQDAAEDELNRDVIVTDMSLLGSALKLLGGVTQANFSPRGCSARGIEYADSEIYAMLPQIRDLDGLLRAYCNRFPEQMNLRLYLSTQLMPIHGKLPSFLRQEMSQILTNLDKDFDPEKAIIDLLLRNVPIQYARELLFGRKGIFDFYDEKQLRQLRQKYASVLLQLDVSKIEVVQHLVSERVIQNLRQDTGLQRTLLPRHSASISSSMDVRSALRTFADDSEYTSGDDSRPASPEPKMSAELLSASSAPLLADAASVESKAAMDIDEESRITIKETETLARKDKGDEAYQQALTNTANRLAPKVQATLRAEKKDSTIAEVVSAQAKKLVLEEYARQYVGEIHHRILHTKWDLGWFGGVGVKELGADGRVLQNSRVSHTQERILDKIRQAEQAWNKGNHKSTHWIDLLNEIVALGQTAATKKRFIATGDDLQTFYSEDLKAYGQKLNVLRTQLANQMGEALQQKLTACDKAIMFHSEEPKATRSPGLVQKSSSRSFS